MKRKLSIIFGFVGVFALSVGFSKGLPKEHVDISNGDFIKVVTVEEQNLRENKTVQNDEFTTVITAKEQQKVENSGALSGFLPQENGPGFYFIKEK